ncbi:hypothetical protein Q3G72_010136 [Acer saccharum]|nr:hypothetical protein Q3G72_010136 [Acer saccharum]
MNPRNEAARQLHQINEFHFLYPARINQRKETAENSPKISENKPGSKPTGHCQKFTRDPTFSPIGMKPRRKLRPLSNNTTASSSHGERTHGSKPRAHLENYKWASNFLANQIILFFTHLSQPAIKSTQLALLAHGIDFPYGHHFSLLHLELFIVFS